jgi:hypothetical protein
MLFWQMSVNRAVSLKKYPLSFHSMPSGRYGSSYAFGFTVIGDLAFRIDDSDLVGLLIDLLVLFSRKSRVRALFCACVSSPFLEAGDICACASSPVLAEEDI